MVCDVDIPHIGTYIFPLLLNVCLIIVLVMYVERGLYIYYFGGNLLVRQVISVFHLWQDAIFCTFFPLIDIVWVSTIVTTTDSTLWHSSLGGLKQFCAWKIFIHK